MIHNAPHKFPRGLKTRTGLGTFRKHQAPLVFPPSLRRNAFFVDTESQFKYNLHNPLGWTALKRGGL
jgi:hypothetical protein